MTTSLADHLRTLPADGLAALLRMRPDLAVPVPADLSALATRAQTRLSVARALEDLDLFTLQILDALRLVVDAAVGGDRPDLDAVLELAAGAVPAEAVRAAVDRLRTAALIYGPDHALHVVGTVEELCSPYPAGLGRPAAALDRHAADLVADPARLRRTLIAAPPAARAVLDRLAAGPPLGAIRDARRPTEPTGPAQPAGPGVRPGPGMRPGPGLGPAGPGATQRTGPGIGPAGPGDGQQPSPVRWLIARHLLVPIADDTVELPREVGLLLRRETGPLGPLQPEPPPIMAPVKDLDAVDSAGAGQAMETVRYVDTLLEALSGEPAPVLKAGGIGVRDLRRLAKTAGLEEPIAALALEVAHAAGLLDQTNGSATGGLTVATTATAPAWLPTAAYDTWRVAPLADRWTGLARAWLDMARQPGVIGERDDKDRVVAALSAPVDRPGAAALRRAALDTLADLPAGVAVGAEDVLAQLRWWEPRRGGRYRDDAARWAVGEAATLGLTGLGALTRYGRALLAEAAAPDVDDDPLGVRAWADGGERPRTPAGILDALLPAPVDHVLLQADLSMVVPGPPEPTLAAELALVATPESAGGATVYRITADSVRRALDAGYAAGDLHALFARRSRTPVPQALSYLVDDVARRHGGLRTGACAAYLRADDAALLAELVADRRLAGLALRRLAPTVLVTPVPPGRLLDTLRDAGYAPVPEDASGAVVLHRPTVLRVPARPRPPVPGPAQVPRPLDGPQLDAVVEQIRRGDALARAARRTPVTKLSVVTAEGSLEQALAVLRQALRERQEVWVGYVDPHGTTVSRKVRPVSLGAGYLRAEDDRSETLHTFALARITSAVLAD